MRETSYNRIFRDEVRLGPLGMAERGKTQNRGNKAKKLLKIKDITF